MKKQLLVSVDRGETRVALLEATGTPGAAKKEKAPSARGRKDPAPGRRLVFAACLVTGELALRFEDGDSCFATVHRDEYLLFHLCLSCQ